MAEVGKSSACQRLVSWFGQLDFSVSSVSLFVCTGGREGKVKDVATRHHYHWVFWRNSIPF